MLNWLELYLYYIFYDLTYTSIESVLHETRLEECMKRFNVEISCICVVSPAYMHILVYTKWIKHLIEHKIYFATSVSCIMHRIMGLFCVVFTLFLSYFYIRPFLLLSIAVLLYSSSSCHSRRNVVIAPSLQLYSIRNSTSFRNTNLVMYVCVCWIWCYYLYILRVGSVNLYFSTFSKEDRVRSKFAASHTAQELPSEFSVLRANNRCIWYKAAYSISKA